MPYFLTPNNYHIFWFGKRCVRLPMSFLSSSYRDDWRYDWSGWEQSYPSKVPKVNPDKARLVALSIHSIHGLMMFDVFEYFILYRMCIPGCFVFWGVKQRFHHWPTRIQVPVRFPQLVRFGSELTASATSELAGCALSFPSCMDEMDPPEDLTRGWHGVSFGHLKPLVPAFLWSFDRPRWPAGGLGLGIWLRQTSQCIISTLD